MFHLACIRKYTRPRPPPRKLYPRPFARSSLFLSPEEQRQRLASAKLHRLLLDSRPLSSFPPYKTSLAGFFLAALRAASTLDNKATAAVRKGKLGIRPRNYPSNFFNAKSSALFARYAFSRIWERGRERLQYVSVSLGDAAWNFARKRLTRVRGPRTPGYRRTRACSRDKARVAAFTLFKAFAWTEKERGLVLVALRTLEVLMSTGAFSRFC